jgi:hypothetical protein
MNLINNKTMNEYQLETKKENKQRSKSNNEYTQIIFY